MRHSASSIASTRPFPETCPLFHNISCRSHRCKEAIVINSPTIDADSTLELLVRIEAANPGAESIYVICDNAVYCHSRKVTEQSLFFFECLSEHADRLKSLLTLNKTE